MVGATMLEGLNTIKGAYFFESLGAIYSLGVGCWYDQCVSRQLGAIMLGGLDTIKLVGQTTLRV